MNGTQESSFERLRAEISRDLGPVKPLGAAWRSALVALPIALLLLSLVLVVYGLRSDASELGVWPLWGPAIVMVLAAYVILLVALMQRAPESTLSWGWWLLLPLAAVGLQVGGAYLTLQYNGASGPMGWEQEAMCFWRISLLGVPPVLLVLLLLSRGLPLRPKVAGLLAGVGGGLLSEGIYRLHCGSSHPAHVIPWHSGAILVMGLLGFLAGLWWERRRLKQWLDRRS